MAQVNLLKIGATGLPTEHGGTDDLTMASFTSGSVVLSSTGLVMAGTDLSGVNNLSFTDPTTDGIIVTAGTFSADSILFAGKENTLSAATTALLFSTVTDSADQVDAFRLPALAGVPSATPTDGGEGYLVWNSADNQLHAWDGSAWQNQSQASSMNVAYTAGETLLARDAVYISGADEVSKADASAESTARVIGFSQGAVTAAASGDIQTSGVLSGFTGLTAGAPQYLSETAGLVTESVPTTSGAAIVRLGYAKNTTDLQIDVQQIGIRA